jgi:hypothetical protein
MGKRDVFKVGDFVFARIKGYRPWPAKVIQMCSKQKYHVYFYGTAEVGKNVKNEDLSYYQEKKEKLVKPGSLKGDFKIAIEQIEAAIGGNDTCPPPEELLNKTDQHTFVEHEEAQEKRKPIPNKQNDSAEKGQKRKINDSLEDAPMAKKTEVTTPEATDVQSYIEIVDPATLQNIDDEKFPLLELEWKIFQTMENIKSNLSLEKADTQKCLNLLDEIVRVVPDLTQLMLKKNPNFVDMVKRLRRYVGNVPQWKLSKKDKDKFDTDATEIRDMASNIYQEIKDKFQYDEAIPFWQSFTKIVTSFNQRVTKCDKEFLTKLCFDEELP